MVRWQLRNLAKDEQVSCVAKMKTGPSIEVYGRKPQRAGDAETFRRKDAAERR